MTKLCLSTFMFSAVSTAALTSSALADPTHIASQGGHSHWLGLAAIGLALVVIIGFMKLRAPVDAPQNTASDKV